jgi:hypothetical protein
MYRSIMRVAKGRVAGRVALNGGGNREHDVEIALLSCRKALIDSKFLLFAARLKISGQSICGPKPTADPRRPCLEGHPGVVI